MSNILTKRYQRKQKRLFIASLIRVTADGANMASQSLIADSKIRLPNEDFALDPEEERALVFRAASAIATARMELVDLTRKINGEEE